MQNWVLTGVVDFALVNGHRPSNARLECERLAVERLFAIEQPGGDGPPGDRVALSELLEGPLLLPSARNPIRDLIDRAAESLGCSAEVTLEVDSASLLTQLAAEGFARAVLPFAAVQEEVAAGKILARAIVQPEIRSDLNLIYLRDRPPSKVAAQVIRLMLEILEEIESSDKRHGFVEICRPAKHRR